MLINSFLCHFFINCNQSFVMLTPSKHNILTYYGILTHLIGKYFLFGDLFPFGDGEYVFFCD